MIVVSRSWAVFAVSSSLGTPVGSSLVEGVASGVMSAPKKGEVVMNQHQMLLGGIAAPETLILRFLVKRKGLAAASPLTPVINGCRGLDLDQRPVSRPAS